MRSRIGDAAWLDAANRLAAALFAVFAAVATLTKLVGGPTWLAIAFGVIGVVGAVVSLVLGFLHERAKRTRFYVRAPLRAREAAGTGLFYEIGVDPEAREALVALGVEDEEHAPYIERGVDGELRAALAEAAARRDVSLIVLSGPSKAGKSRTLLEAAAAALPDAWLLVPKGPATLAEMTSRGAVGENPTPLLIWLDDLEPWVKQREEGLNTGTLLAFRRWERPVLVLATKGGKGIDEAGADATRLNETVVNLLVLGRSFELDPRLTSAEAASLTARFGPEATEQVEDIGGIAEFMIAAPRLIERLMAKSDCPQGQAVVWAAIDMRRAGLLRAARASELEALYPTYLAGTPSSPADEFAVGLRWATRPLYASTALLSQADGADEYFPHDYVVEHAWREHRQIDPEVWDRVIDAYAETDDELTDVASIALAVGDMQRAERAARRADRYGYASGANNLGVILAKGGDLPGARAAWQRADDRGDAAAAANIGLLILRDGDLDGAEAAFRRADERGHAGAAFDLGRLLLDAGDEAGAEAAWRRADERGDRRATYGLGTLLERRGDPGAEALYTCADERGDPAAAWKLGSLLAAHGELAAAEAAYRRADERGSAPGAAMLGRLLNERGDLVEGDAAFRRADERGEAVGAYLVGIRLAQDGELEQAEKAFSRALERATSEQEAAVIALAGDALERIARDGGAAP